MKNTHAWAIIGVVFVVALGSIWYMVQKVGEYPDVSDTATTTGDAMMDSKGGAMGGAVSKPATGGTVTPGATDSRPKITKLTPASGRIGTVAAISGMNFDATSNVITFGPSKGLHHEDGTPDNQVAGIPSADGKTLTFKVPTSKPGGNLCDINNKCEIHPTQQTEPGTYAVRVINKNGLSNEMMFTVVE
ncbi:MAG: hypothetical protein AB202_02575 [Parcubacteria bacterium C7867-007]|nr:MAG: hypothetical protein AB202_02575 [Parcubacteria bacterium C7867-007]